MTPTVLDLYILMLVDRGSVSKYDLLTQGGISLGSSSPAIRRMQAEQLMVQGSGDIRGKRPRYELKLSSKGRLLLRGGWQGLFVESSDADLDAILRLTSIAEHHRAKRSQIAAFLRAMAVRRAAASRSLSSVRPATEIGQSVMEMHAKWTSTRLRAEATFLVKLAEADFSDKRLRSTKLRPAKAVPKK